MRLGRMQGKGDAEMMGVTRLRPGQAQRETWRECKRERCGAGIKETWGGYWTQGKADTEMVGAARLRLGQAQRES